jgi:nucleoid-associated protein YgaU
LPPASGARDEGSVALATAQSEANGAAAAVARALSPNSQVTDESVPAFDVARIDQTGDAVIAGRAAPGAIVELLRNGERHDRVVADHTGQFIMVPPRLPPGSYELTLRSTQPDGKQVISKQRVAIALDEVESSSRAARAEAPLNIPETAVANRSAVHQTVGPSEGHQPSKDALQIAKRKKLAVSPLPDATAVPLSDRASSAAVLVPKVATTVVSRGDSLWRISHVNYGAGMRYAAIYKANRDQIRDPNRIYPGQIFVLPKKAR